MKRKRTGSVPCFCVVAWMVGHLGPLAAQGEADPLAKLAAPGEHHQHMQKLAGEWKTTSKMWMEPGKPPIESTGTMQVVPILGGRFLQSKFHGELMGRAFDGVGIDGYDNQKQKHIGMWIDSMGTMMLSFEGTCSEGGRVTTTLADYVDPTDGQAKTMKSVTTVVDDGTIRSEIQVRPAAGGEFVKMMEMVYTR